MSTNSDALMAAVFADPSNDLPRLLFADSLDDCGEANWAKFIRVQCEAARDGNHGFQPFNKCIDELKPEMDAYWRLKLEPVLRVLWEEAQEQIDQDDLFLQIDPDPTTCSQEEWVNSAKISYHRGFPYLLKYIHLAIDLDLPEQFTALLKISPFSLAWSYLPRDLWQYAIDRCDGETPKMLARALKNDNWVLQDIIIRDDRKMFDDMMEVGCAIKSLHLCSAVEGMHTHMFDELMARQTPINEQILYTAMGLLRPREEQPANPYFYQKILNAIDVGAPLEGDGLIPAMSNRNHELFDAILKRGLPITQEAFDMAHRIATPLDANYQPDTYFRDKIVEQKRAVILKKWVTPEELRAAHSAPDSGRGA